MMAAAASMMLWCFALVCFFCLGVILAALRKGDL